MKQSDAIRSSGNRFRIKINTLTLLLAGIFSTGFSAYAQTQTAPLAPATVLANATVPVQIVVISGARYEQFVEDLPLSMDIIGWQEMESGHIADIHDLARNLPNISVKRAPARFTVTGVGNATGRDDNAGFNIRGQDGNRVLMLVDGVRLPRSYINGSNAFGRDS